MVPMDMSPDSIQKIMLTPKLLLSMHVLQLNIMDLRIFIRAELEENPLLEEENQEVLSLDEEGRFDEKITMLIDREEQDLTIAGQEKEMPERENKQQYLENKMTKKESLYEHLHWQLEVLAENEEQKRIGDFIIGNLDEHGFLNMDLKKIQESVNADRADFKRALNLIRNFDPAGVGARNLKESLLLQLVYSGKGNTHLYRIVYSHLEDLEKGYFDKISRALSISLAEVQREKKRISYLNPNPAAGFGGEETVFTSEPDVFFTKNNGAYVIEVNEENQPKLNINKLYQRVLTDRDACAETKEYIRKKLANALWLIEALIQRKKTIIRVCEYLIEEQRNFLEFGDMAMKPLTLKQAANSLSISEATVSRVVSNKYAQLHNRLLSLKEFFAGRIKTADGDVLADRNIKRKILDFIEKEDKKQPLSDQGIASILHKEGIKISRRTVTKYRQKLKILPFCLRKLK